MTKKTPRQIAESQIRNELTKQGKTFICYGTFVDNSEMRNVINAALREQRKASKPTPAPAFAVSSFARAIRFKYKDNCYYAEMNNGTSNVHLFNGGILSPEVLFSAESNPEICRKAFIKYMENLE